MSTLFVPFKQQMYHLSAAVADWEIGLNISPAIAGAHKGRIKVTQDQGHITFSLGLPLQAA
jgi:nitrogen-specific signal transduction histidine kinase